MKYFFISDIHGSLQALERVLEIFNRGNYDKLIILGDIMYHGPRNPLPKDYNPAEVAVLLNKYKSKIIACRGNCDSEVDQMLLDFPIMSDYSLIGLEERSLFLTHGHIFSPDKLPNLNDGDIFVFGHVHLPIVEKRRDVFIFNPGSIALPKGGNVPTYGTLEGKRLSINDFFENTIVSMTV